MFEIQLLKGERGPDGQRLGVITVGDFTERFACCAIIGNVDALPEQWLTALRSLCDGALSVALVHDPRFAWLIYREAENCFVQQRMSLDGDLQSIPPRETVTEDGDRISEWAVGLPEIRQFVETQQPGA